MWHIDCRFRSFKQDFSRFWKFYRIVIVMVRKCPDLYKGNFCHVCISLLFVHLFPDEETGLEIHKLSHPPSFNMERRRSRAVLYQLSGHLQDKTKSKLKINNVSHVDFLFGPGRIWSLVMNICNEQSQGCNNGSRLIDAFNSSTMHWQRKMFWHPHLIMMTKDLQNYEIRGTFIWMNNVKFIPWNPPCWNICASCTQTIWLTCFIHVLEFCYCTMSRESLGPMQTRSQNTKWRTSRSHASSSFTMVLSRLAGIGSSCLLRFMLP